MVPAEDSTKDEVAEQIGRAGDEGAGRRPAAEPRSSRASRSRTRSPASAPRAGRPTACCTCWRSPARPGSTFRSTTSRRSPRRTPLLADLKPGGRFVATDLYRAGGVPLVLNRLSEAGLLHRDEMTVSGRTIGEEADASPRRRPGGRPPAVGPAEEGGRPGDPARQPGARGLGGEAGGHRAPRPDRARPASSTPRRSASAPSRPARSRRATSS